MNEDFGGGFSRSPSSASSAGPPGKKKGAQTVRSVHIKQLLEAEQQHDLLDGKPLGQVTIVAVILEIEVKSTNVAFILEDSTGQIQASKFIDKEDYQKNEITEYKEGMYIRIFGNFSTFQGNKSITVYKISVVKNFNEITFHHLDVVHTHLYMTRGSIQNADTTMASSFIADGQGEFNPLQQQVIDVFKADSSERGVHVDLVVQKLSSRFDPQQIRRAIEELSRDGYLYSVADEFHFRCTT